jgi:hypothetical protein
MKFKKMKEKKRMLFLFTGYYIFSVILLLAVLTVFWENRPLDRSAKAKKQAPLSDEQKLAQATSLLQGHLKDLQQLDEKYIKLLKDSGIAADFDGLASKISFEELAFNKTIDSIDKTALYGRTIDKVNQLVFSCRSILENHRSIDLFEQSVAAGSKKLDSDRQVLQKLSSNLTIRDSVNQPSKIQTTPDHPEKSEAKTSDADYRQLRSAYNSLKSELEELERKFDTMSDLKNASSSLNKIGSNQHLNETGKSSVVHKLSSGNGDNKTAKYEGETKQ